MKKYYTILTSAFSHQDPLHLLVNMIALWFFGRPIELAIGSARLLYLYLAGAVGGFAGIWWRYKRKYWNAPLPNVLGASGATTAVFAYFICGNPWQPVLFFFVPMPAVVAGIIIFFMGTRGSDGYISHSGHLGGAVMGGVYYLMMRGIR